MADQGSQEQLLELLIQLKKTTPKAARDILNSQPAIAYALISLMVSMGAINIEVFQKTLAQFHEAAARSQSQSTPSATPAPTTVPLISPAPALPPHLQAQYRTATPPAAVPTPPATQYGYPNQPGYPLQGYAQQNNHSTPYAYGAQQQQGYPSYPAAGSSQGHAVPPATNARVSNAPAIKPELFAAFPEEQKALIMHVVSMTQEQLNKLPPDQRNTYMQIRATLGIS